MKKISTLIAFTASALSPLSAFAVTIQQAPKGVRSFEGFLSIFDTLITWLFTILLVLAVIFIILAAFQYLTAGGEEEKIKKAHQKIIYAIVGIAVAFLAQGISFVVGQLLNSGNAGVNLGG